MNKQTILLFGDTHEPYSHKDTLKFLIEVKKKYKPTEVIHMGDEIDSHAMSFHDSDPDLSSASDELQEAINKLKPYYKLFPKLTLLDSNHGSMHYRKGKHHGIPRKYLKDYNDILEAPKGWKWVIDYTIKMNNGQKLFLTHGMQKNTGRFARNMGMCVAQGHYHTDFGVEYNSNPTNLIWGLDVGCLIDKKSLAFAYDKANIKRPILGCAIIEDGIPKLIPMVLNQQGKWVGKL